MIVKTATTSLCFIARTRNRQRPKQSAANRRLCGCPPRAAPRLEESHGEETDRRGGGPKGELAEQGRRSVDAGPRSSQHAIGKIRGQPGGGPITELVPGFVLRFHGRRSEEHTSELQ